MSKSMETNTAAIYLRKSTEDDGKSVAQQEQTRCVNWRKILLPTPTPR